MNVLDTTVAVDHLRGLPSAVALLRRLSEGGEPLLASELVRFELLAGVRDHALETLEEFFEALAWLPVSEEVARVAGALARQHRPGHSGTDDADYLIAASALVLDSNLLTTNVRQFPMIVGLQPPY